MRASVVIVIIVTLSGCDPMWPLPGGALDGDITTTPADWTHLAKIETIQLETNPEDPYSVNLWLVSLDRRLYVAAGGGETRWSGHISRDPNVRLRIGENIYELVATTVHDNDELEEVREAYIAKYAMNPESEQFNDSLVFRLDRPL